MVLIFLIAAAIFITGLIVVAIRKGDRFERLWAVVGVIVLLVMVIAMYFLGVLAIEVAA